MEGQGRSYESPRLEAFQLFAGKFPEKKSIFVYRILLLYRLQFPSGNIQLLCCGVLHMNICLALVLSMGSRGLSAQMPGAPPALFSNFNDCRVVSGTFFFFFPLLLTSVQWWKHIFSWANTQNCSWILKNKPKHCCLFILLSILTVHQVYKVFLAIVRTLGNWFCNLNPKLHWAGYLKKRVPW